MKVTKILMSLMLMSLTLVGARAAGPGIDINGAYSRHVFVDTLNNRMPFRMLKPSAPVEGVKYPLVLFLHGSGERGTDNEKQLLYGASVFSNPANAERYPSYVVFPQCKERTWTEKVDERTFMPGSPVPPESRTEETLVALVRDLVKLYPIDTRRIYVVGISMGGIAAYDLACRYPELFAAAIPICGAINPDRLDDMKEVKFMIFHGAADDEVPVVCSREAYKTLSNAGAAVEYVEFAGEGHECWSSAFNYPTFLPWLYSQSKEPVTDSTEGLALSEF